MVREGEMELTQDQNGRPTEFEGAWSEISTPNDVGVGAECPRAEQDYETLLVRGRDRDHRPGCGAR